MSAEKAYQPFESSLLEQVRSLPPEQQREVLDFAEFLARRAEKTPKGKDLYGSLAHMNIRVSEEDLADARREMLGGFPRTEPR